PIPPGMPAPIPIASTPYPATPSDAPADLRGKASELALLALGQRVLDGATVSFVADHGPIERQLTAWAAAIGAAVELKRVGAEVHGTVRLRSEPEPGVAWGTGPAALQRVEAPGAAPRKNKAALLVLRNDFESLMAAMMVANASAAQGMEVEVYFSFWGVNVLRARNPKPGTALQRASSPLKKMMKWMMPAGPESQPMSKMNFGGVGLGMMKSFMREQRVLSLTQLMREAATLEVKFVVCTMSMGIMGIDKADLMELPNLGFGGVTSFTAAARESSLSLVF
ncbi:MAG: DsrE/DsrF/DrsH-like family protein, partial [Myxococcota bacterium]